MSAALCLVPPLTLPPIRCASWCWDGNGHIGAGHVEDQFCVSNLPGDTIDIGEDSQVAASLLALPGQQAEVEVAVVTGLRAAVIRLAPSDARRFALAILTACDLENGVTRGGAA